MDYISCLFQPKQSDEKSIDFDEDTIKNTYCSKCLKFPEYLIRFSSASAFSLFHSCLNGEIIEKPLDSLHNSPKLKFKCYYCKKECQNICIKCKYILCKECFAIHNRVPLLECIKIAWNEIANKDTYMNLINSQYFCEQHLSKYNFYCPLCKINLCDSCKKRHIHINCINILALNIKSEDIIEPSNNCFKRLYKLAKIFHSCYQKSIDNSKMTKNILLNNILANNIIEFIRKSQAPFKGSEIKNNYLFNIDKNSYLFNKYDDSEFNAYYRSLIYSACGGNIMDYYRLYEIRNAYNANELPNIFNWNLYHDILGLRISNFINLMESIIEKFNISDIKLNLSKCFEKISNLKLKNELNTFSFELIKVFALKMNYKLDYELRRKVGNILGQLILQKFYENLNTIQPTKYLLTLSNEKIAKEISISNSKKNYKSSDPKINGNDNSLNSKFKKSLIELINKAEEEMEKLDYQSAQNNNAIITFKSLNKEQKEINKAIIFNLFFYIKKKFGKVFNFQIHNTSHSINSNIAETIKKSETKEKENNSEIDNKDNKTNDNNIDNKDNKDNQNNAHLSNDKINKNGIQNSESKIETNKNEINIDINNICSNIYKVTEKLDREIEIKEEFPTQTDYNLLATDDDSIIQSSVEEFAKTLNKMKSTFSTSAIITLQQSLDLYLEGRKGEILEKVYSPFSMKALVNECREKISSNKELEEVNKFCNDFKKNLDDDLDCLYSDLNYIIANIGEVAQIFDIKNLFNKYGINQPVDLKKAFTKMKKSLYQNKFLEEIYYLIHIISYFLVISFIKALNGIKDEYENIVLNKLIENNIIKENLIYKFMKEVNIPEGDILNQDIWKHIQNCNTFIEDEDMNNNIINYVKEKTINDYKNDLRSLLQPHVKNIDLNGQDPQNIFLDSFMKQNGLSC